MAWNQVGERFGYKVWSHELLPDKSVAHRWANASVADCIPLTRAGSIERFNADPAVALELVGLERRR